MITIHKYPISIAMHQTIQMPAKPCILSVQMQNGVPCIWAMVNTDNDMEAFVVDVRATGYPMTDIGWYLGTVQNGEFVWHVFIGSNHPLFIGNSGLLLSNKHKGTIQGKV